MLLNLNLKYKKNFKPVYRLYIKVISILQLEKLDESLIIYINIFY